MKRYIFFFFALLATYHCFPQQVDTLSQEYKLKVESLKQWRLQEAKDRGYSNATIEKLEDLSSYFSQLPRSIHYVRAILEKALYFEREKTITEALPYYNMAESLYFKSGLDDKKLINKILNRYASALNDQGDNREAIAKSKQLLDYNRRHWSEEVGRNYFNLAVSYAKSNQRELSLIYNDSAYQDCKKYNIHESTPLAYNIHLNRAINFRSIGAIQEAKEAIAKARDVLRSMDKLKMPYYEITNNMYKAYVYSSENSDDGFKVAQDCIDRALQVQNNANPNGIYAYYLHTLQSDNDFLQKKYKESLRHNKRSIEIIKHNFGNNNADITLSYMHSGRIFTKLEMIDSAGYYFDKAVGYFKDDFDPEVRLRYSEVALEAALFYANQGDSEKAKRLTRKAFASFLPRDSKQGLFEIPNDSVLPGNSQLATHFFLKSKVLEQLGKVEENSEFLSASFENMLKCINLVQRDKEGLYSLKSKMQFYKNKGDYFDTAMDLAYQLYKSTNDPYYFKKGLYLADSYKAATIKFMLNESKGSVDKLIPEDLRAKELNLLSDIDFLQEKISDPNQDGLSKEEDKKLLSAKKEEIIALLAKLRTEFPQYYHLQYATSSSDNITDEEIELFLSQKNGLSIQFFENENSWYVLAKNKTKNKFIKIERSVAIKNVVKDFMSKISSPKFLDYRKEGVALYEIFFKPLGEEMLDTENIFIVNDGSLSYISFECLLTSMPMKSIGFKDYPLMIQDYNISYGYSFFSQNLDTKNVQKRNILAMAPFVGKNDLIASTNGEINRSGLEMLRFSRDEVQLLGDQYGAETFFSNHATETNFKQNSSNASIIHLSTHGIIDEVNPMNSMLLMAKDSINDGVLHNYELLKLKFNADLVCLSACETGIGVYQRGEGVMSLARGFQLANVHNVMMTLWKIPDQSSSAIVANFYNYLNKDNDYSKALRQSKLAYISEAPDEMSHPYYWSSFVIIGEAKTTTATNYVYIVLVLFTLAILVLVIYRNGKSSKIKD